MNANKPRSLKFNFLMNAILTMSSFIFPLITFPYVSRILLPSGWGKVSFAISVIAYFSMFAQLGIPTYGIRACAKVRDNREELTRVVHELLLINLITSFITYVFFFIALYNVPKLAEEKDLFLIVNLTILFNAIGMEWLYKALEKYTYITVRSIIFKFIALIAMFLLIHEESDYVIYGGIAIFAGSASNVFNLVHAHKYISFSLLGNYNFKRHIKAVLVFFAMSCATTIYSYLNTVILGFMTNATEVGYYDAAIKIKRIFVSIITSLGVVLLPRASYYVEHGQMDSFYQITKKAINFVALTAVPVTVYFILFAEEGIYFIAGKAYGQSIILMQIIMPTVFLIGLTNIMGMQILVPLGKEKIVLYSEIVGAMVDLLICISLIPVVASVGSAIGLLVAEFSVWTVQFFALRKTVIDAYKQVHYVQLIFAIVVGSLISCLIKLFDLGLFFTLTSSALLFFGTYVGILLLTKEPLAVEITTIVLKKIHLLS